MLQGVDSIILLIIIANVLFSMKGFDDYSFLDKYKFQVGRVLGKEKIRMFTSGFLHVDWMHLGFNMYALYMRPLSNHPGASDLRGFVYQQK